MAEVRQAAVQLWHLARRLPCCQVRCIGSTSAPPPTTIPARRRLRGMRRWLGSTSRTRASPCLSCTAWWRCGALANLACSGCFAVCHAAPAMQLMHGNTLLLTRCWFPPTVHFHPPSLPPAGHRHLLPQVQHRVPRRRPGHLLPLQGGGWSPHACCLGRWSADCWYRVSMTSAGKPGCGCLMKG